MILTDREIMIALQCGHIKIDPQPDETACSSTSIDLTLAPEGLEWKAARGQPIRPGDPGYSYANTAMRQERVALTGYSLDPQSFLLAWTNETVELPITSRLAARVEGKSSIARLGIGISIARLGIGIHITAPTIHAGFKGPIQLEMFNFGPHQIILDPGMKICQLIFELTVGTPEKGYRGMFFDQKPGVS